ncbi:aminotransferase class V-fold PLP-dependent enzyme [Pseudoflavonifractor capillosus]|nr:aminotransferase class V-fold PLP-dependent enzyme [Pseudoflavonifractor capillosus]
MPTPLYDRLVELSHQPLQRLDMPGHHGSPAPGLEFWPAHLDVTEHPATGDLFDPEEDDPIQQAQQLWAKATGMDTCLFLTGGSTQGIQAGLALTAGVGSEVLLDRGSHRSVFNALEQHQKVKTVCIISPTYYGVLSDIPAIAAVCHRHGAKLMVDGAHGAHLPFLGYTGYQSADVVVVSAHKTLPAPGQTALLLARGYEGADLRRVASLTGSSSPNYVLMAGLDVARDYLEGEGRRAYTETAKIVENLRRRLPALTPGEVELDPTRLVLRCDDGHQVARTLMERGIYYEMADSGHVVLIFTCADGPDTATALLSALEGIPLGTGTPLPPPPPPPPQVMRPRQALFAPTQEVAWEEAVGQVCACQLAPYPPGIPVVAPGEKVDKKHLAYLEQIGYNMDSIKVVNDC